jgi:hypothetical protein
MPQIPRTLGVTAPNSALTRTVLSRNTDLSAQRKVPTRAQRRREEQLRKLVRLRYIDRKRIDECAVSLDVSERTIYLWMQKPEFGALVEQMKQEWTEEGRIDIKSKIQLGVQTLVDLVSPATRSEHVRFEAAAKLLDLSGVLEVDSGAATDQTSEANRLARLLEEKLSRPDITVYAQMIQPGGYLPSAGISAAGAQLQAYADKDNNVRVVEAEDPSWYTEQEGVVAETKE